MHDLFKAWHLLLLSIAAVFLASMTLGCGGGARDETVAGAVVPVPRSMERLSGEGIELSLPGFGGGQASFQGNMAPEKIIEFYKKEMPARGWEPGTSLLSRGAMLTYSKEGKSVLLAVGAQDGKSTLSVTISNTNK